MQCVVNYSTARVTDFCCQETVIIFKKQHVRQTSCAWRSFTMKFQHLTLQTLVARSIFMFYAQFSFGGQAYLASVNNIHTLIERISDVRMTLA
jgi:hypothetical protein